MPLSKRYRELRKDLRELRKYLLPKKFEPTGDYSDRILTRTVAYRVLAHAEIESYIEDRALEISKTALTRWKENNYINITTLCLIAFAGIEMDAPPPSLSPDQSTQLSKWDNYLKVSEKLYKSMRIFNSAVNTNHGIKETNLLRLLLPIGINPDALDPVWVSTMNSFGDQRGEAAHKSRSVIKTTQPADPETEFKTVKSILDGLELLDEQLNSLI